jgi:GTP-binding protein
MTIRFESAAYSLSVHDPRKLPSPAVPEVAFIGRSNAGKSSALNSLAGRRRLAFVSKTPGRTQLINFFAIGEDAFLVDLPGYGYASVPLEVRRHWDSLVGGYLSLRESLCGVVVVMDSRHPLAPPDRQFLDWLRPAGRRVHVMLTKCDKLSAQAAQRTLSATRKALAEVAPGATIQLFSSLKRQGIDEAKEHIASWLRDRQQKAPAKGDGPGQKKP